MKVTLVIEESREDSLEIRSGDVAMHVCDCNGRYLFLERLKELLTVTLKWRVE